MSLRINTNIMALNTHRNMQMTDVLLSKSMEKLSSGLRVNRASDDAAGLSISENLRAQIRGLAQAERNAQDGISLINVAEGALNEIHSVLQRVRELAVQAANDTYTADDRATISREIEALVYEIDNILDNTTFNGQALFDGRYDTVHANFQGLLTLQVGANEGQTLEIEIWAPDVELFQLAQLDANGDIIPGTTVSVVPPGDAGDLITSVDASMTTLSRMRGMLGAASNRLESTINNVMVSRENLAAAESRIRDVDMADEMSKFTRSQILMQSGTAMLAQANAQPQNVLGLLG